jgi:enterochelin esterase-like enzyme
LENAEAEIAAAGIAAHAAHVTETADAVDTVDTADTAVAAATPPAAPAPPPVPRPIAADAPLAAAWEPGRIHVLGPLAVPGHAPRQVRVFLPSTFTPGEPRFALYLFDGQNVFDDAPSFAGGWRLHEAVEQLAQRGRPAPVVVAVDHGGELRIHELSPFAHGGVAGRLDSLLDWLTGSLMPRLGSQLPLIGGPVGAVIGGSSMGGLAAFYAHLHAPQSFGGALAMSPSFWLSHGEIVRWAAAQPAPEVSRIYLDCGVREGRGTVLPLVAEVAAQLTARGYDADHLMLRADPRGSHSETSWRRRLPRALRFFYRTPGT